MGEYRVSLYTLRKSLGILMVFKLSFLINSMSFDKASIASVLNSCYTELMPILDFPVANLIVYIF